MKLPDKSKQRWRRSAGSACDREERKNSLRKHKVDPGTHRGAWQRRPSGGRPTRERAETRFMITLVQIVIAEQNRHGMAHDRAPR
jgi:hypothetical protein